MFEQCQQFLNRTLGSIFSRGLEISDIWHIVSIWGTNAASHHRCDIDIQFVRTFELILG